MLLYGLSSCIFLNIFNNIIEEIKINKKHGIRIGMSDVIEIMFMTIFSASSLILFVINILKYLIFKGLI